MDIQLDDIETRVLGCLLEKERTTPDAYPLTLLALQSACNQKSSRWPVMSLTTQEIESALDRMRYEKHVVYQVAQAGSRVPKFEHNISKIGTFSEPDIAILTVLMLRGAQTAGEIKTHCERLYQFGSRDEAEKAVEDLRLAESGPFLTLLPREAGRRERRYAHLLSGEPVVGESGENDTAPTEATPSAGDPARLHAPSSLARIEALESQVAALTAELNRIKIELGLANDIAVDAHSTPPTEARDTVATPQQV